MNKQHIIVKERPLNTQFVYRGHTLIVRDRRIYLPYTVSKCRHCFFKKQCDYIKYIMKIRYNNMFFEAAIVQKRHSCGSYRRTDNTSIYYEEINHS